LAGFLESTVQDIDARMEELRGELDRLEAARSALVGAGSRRSAARSGDGAATRTRGSARRGPGRRGGNTRAAQALELVRQRPGITIPEIAEAMGIEPNYLYRVMPRLLSEGQITRDGQGWHPAG
jgi:CRP-like cAMP-binding protein